MKEAEKLVQDDQNKRIEGFFGEYRFLSNFVTSPVWYEGIPFPTVEHAYQAAKTEDIDVQLEIADLDIPAKAKRAGNQLLIREDWDDVKVDIMRDLVTQKFRQKEFAEKLKATGDAYLEETNTWRDTFWGVCDGKGFNKLGEILMSIRKKL